MQLTNLSVAPRLTRKYGVAVCLENDVNAALLGERHLGAARGASNIIGLFLGTGLGGAIIAHGMLITGAHRAAGEIGHMIVEDDGPRCTCGNCGCVEAFVGRWAIDRDIREAVRTGRKTVLARSIPQDEKRLIASSSIREALEKGDELAGEIISGVARRLALACISLRHVLDPEVVVFGGGLIGVCGAYIMPLVEERIAEDPYYDKLSTCRVVMSRLGPDAGILGAVVVAACTLGMRMPAKSP
jgi:glucokinase